MYIKKNCKKRVSLIETLIFFILLKKIINNLYEIYKIIIIYLQKSIFFFCIEIHYIFWFKKSVNYRNIHS